MSTLAGRRGMRPKMMMPFDAQPPQRKCPWVNVGVVGLCPRIEKGKCSTNHSCPFHAFKARVLLVLMVTERILKIYLNNSIYN